jgi:hypothetical protein
MRKLAFVLSFLLAAVIAHAAPPSAPPTWKAKVAATLPLLGHRNWILVVDSAYPLQTSPGVETVETNADQLEVVRSVLSAIAGSIHVRPVISMDAELPFVPEEDAPGISAYRARIADLLHGFPVESAPHDRVIADIAEAGKQFHVLILKTKLAIPYTSVFIRLDCKYWSADAERRLRTKMAGTPPPAH